MMSLWGLDSPSQKWNKLWADYALMSVQTRAHFFSFKMGNVESVIEIQHRFGAVYSEMAIQGMPQPDEVQARMLMTYLSDRWRQYVDNIAIHSPAPTVAEIFARMKMLEERQNARDEVEHGEVNYVGRGGGGNRGFGGGGHQHQQQQQPLRQKFGAKVGGMSTSVCYYCGKTQHYAKVRHSSHGLLQLLQGLRSRSECLQEDK